MACRESSYMVGRAEASRRDPGASSIPHSLELSFLIKGARARQPNAAEDLQGSLIENNTPKLVEDIEKLREHLQVTSGAGARGVVGLTLAWRTPGPPGEGAHVKRGACSCLSRKSRLSVREGRDGRPAPRGLGGLLQLYKGHVRRL